MKTTNPASVSPPSPLAMPSPERVADAYAVVRRALLEERGQNGHWTGGLSTSALSTATAVMALEMIRRARAGGGEVDPRASARRTPEAERLSLDGLIENGLAWLAGHQNPDGGWGDTTKSLSNISTTMLAHAVFHATGTAERYDGVVAAARGFVDRAGGIPALLARYGKDRTFSIPILTHCALAGLVDWREVKPLPFELACLPAQFYKTVRLPVVSYALPALIAIGQVRYHHGKPWNPLTRIVRRLAVRRSLRVLESIQPENGGFLEAAPLTSFVTMSLAGMGLADHAVARKGVEFLVKSVRPDGSWPIDTNLATWVTTLSVNALGSDLPEADRPPIREWLLAQQYRDVHPYTNAAPGGWAWTDLPGGVPDADDTPGALLALMQLEPPGAPSADAEGVDAALARGVRWLLDLQNGDGGWPTFCRGWGALPFDRSAPDITAHALRAIGRWRGRAVGHARLDFEARLLRRAPRAIDRGFAYLGRAQRSDGAWLPLWFGNQFAPDDENPTYGTARVLAAYRDLGRIDRAPARRGLRWLCAHQNADGGWGGVRGTPSSVEETALAAEVLLAADPRGDAAARGLGWLLDRVENGGFRESAPIGFYFAKLWYFERLYPLALMLAALRRAVSCGKGDRTQDDPG